MDIRLGNAFQCQKLLHSKHEEEEPPLLYIKQPNPGTSTIYLGLQIAEDLNWKEHINNTCKKDSSTL